MSIEFSCTSTGRPFPMRGRFFANIFVHFEPLGSFRKDPDDFSSEVLYQKEALESIDVGLPPYVIPGSPWESEWRVDNPDGWLLLENDLTDAISSNNLRVVDNLYIQSPESLHALDEHGGSSLHLAVSSGHLEMTKYLFNRNVDANAVDHNGWSPLHEAVHGGYLEIVKFFYENNVDINLTTGNQEGDYSALDLARELHGENSDMYQFLFGIGAKGRNEL
jgi:prolyl 4-hydroxylase